MVFFTCNHCGSSLKKNKVEKHYAVECRKPPAVSCIDCLKDFFGDEYVSHNKCVTEQQKYSGQPIDDKAQLGKGERKQMEWVESVRQIIETKGSTLTPQERQVLEKMKDFENIPRKKKKFENFMKNAIGRYVDFRTIENVWSLLEAQKVESSKKEAPVTEENSNSPKKTDEKEPQAGKLAEPEPENADQSPAKETAKLSKKEKKEKKKKQKYELELENISKEKQALDNDLGEVDMDLDQGETPEEGKGSKSKKNKKKKKKVEEQNVEENVEAVVVNGTKGGEKKKGKRKHNGNVEDEGVDKKRMKGAVENGDKTENEDAGVTETDVNGDTSEEVKKKGKFKWDKTILAVLQAVPDRELLVKRLRKKVLSEYQEAVGEGKCQELSLEEALGTFERKLHKIPGVKVHKEKAKLAKES